MSSSTYHYARTVDLPMSEAEPRVRETLREQGFGVLTEIDIQATLKAKLDVDVRPYKILGACNPSAAHRALQAEPLIGTMLPCNVVLRDAGDGQTEVAAVDPVASMTAVDNLALGEIAAEIRDRLRLAIDHV
ncbi:MAG TPA: DUF302 domain-containing protein [Bacteroidetes bacterium]|uniref:DUF302 domain-containing protein n=1 Tax=Rubrivirga sp. SAORIC476 TaxID=1961794 RepID=UPI000BA90212|nr:DUF302 domain-containing protein [Rubrivirga sp. SAORIC476]MBC14544.1 DUF302 domain-containing protein [Rhodothermaceae bacterium]PAP78945.1 hypothetical protein B1759_16045 [Rubrivirga sp. SAORIC476]HIG74645.1 DUF302 domain-containing protein [Bacteroidota bacterium]